MKEDHDDLRNRVYDMDKIPNIVKESVDHPNHYGGDVTYEVIKVIEAWEKMFPSFNFNRATAVKYIPRAGEKDKAKELEDLKKARWYIDREISKLEAK